MKNNVKCIKCGKPAERKQGQMFVCLYCDSRKYRQLDKNIEKALRAGRPVRVN